MKINSKGFNPIQRQQARQLDSEYIARICRSQAIDRGFSEPSTLSQIFR
jgi:hypothetical protein